MIEESDDKFEVLIFPSTLPDFLIPKELYEQSHSSYLHLLNQGQLIGNSFKKRGVSEGPNYIIEAIKNFEGLVNIDTNWQSLECRVD